MVRLIVDYMVHDGWGRLEGIGNSIQAACDIAWRDRTSADVDEAKDLQLEKIEIEGVDLTEQANHTLAIALNRLRSFSDFEDLPSAADAIRSYQAAAAGMDDYNAIEEDVLSRMELLFGWPVRGE